MKNKKSIKWLDIENEKNQFFAVAAFMHLDETRKIRFAIDKKSAGGIKAVLTQKPFKEKYGNDYSYWYSGYSIDKSENIYEYYVEIRLGKMRRKAKVHCSKTFCQNLKWLSNIETISDLNGLSI